MALLSRIIGCGAYLPKKVVSNKDLAEALDTSDEWIRERSGISQRHVASSKEMTSDLAFVAAQRAIENANVEVDELDLIVLGTTTPDDTFPATAVKVQSKLGMKHGAAFDIQAACSGFIYGLSIADNMIKTGQIQTALVVGADTLTKLIDWNDRTTAVLFGDGAGAVVLTAEKQKDPGIKDGIISTHIHSDGSLRDILYCDNSLGLQTEANFIQMKGKEVFRHAINNLADVVIEALAANKLSSEEIDWLVPHQANKRIIDNTAKKLQMTEDKIILTIGEHANTSAASIPLALDEAISDGRIEKGNLILMEAMGGGLTWGAALVRI